MNEQCEKELGAKLMGGMGGGMPGMGGMGGNNPFSAEALNAARSKPKIAAMLADPGFKNMYDLVCMQPQMLM